MSSRDLVGPFALSLDAADAQEGFAHDCLVAGTREIVGLTFYRVDQFDALAKKVGGQVTAVVWMPYRGAEELHRQLGEALTQLAWAAEGEVVSVEHEPRSRVPQ